jgi:hypothetical protein
MYLRVRLACRHEGLSRREAARRFGIDRRTVSKILAFSVPPGYRRSRPPRLPNRRPAVTEMLEVAGQCFEATIGFDSATAQPQPSWLLHSPIKIGISSSLYETAVGLL